MMSALSQSCSEMHLLCLQPLENCTLWSEIIQIVMYSLAIIKHLCTGASGYNPTARVRLPYVLLFNFTQAF